MWQYNIKQKEFENPKKVQFEVERIDGVVMFTPKTLEVNMLVSLIRTTSSNDKTSNEIPFKYKDKLYSPNQYLDPYGFPRYINHFTFNYTGEYVNNINEFNFDELPDKIKLRVELFEYKRLKINLKSLF